MYNDHNDHMEIKARCLAGEFWTIHGSLVHGGPNAKIEVTSGRTGATRPVPFIRTITEGELESQAKALRGVYEGCALCINHIANKLDPTNCKME